MFEQRKQDAAASIGIRLRLNAYEIQVRIMDRCFDVTLEKKKNPKRERFMCTVQHVAYSLRAVNLLFRLASCPMHKTVFNVHVPFLGVFFFASVSFLPPFQRYWTGAKRELRGNIAHLRSTYVQLTIIISLAHCRKCLMHFYKYIFFFEWNVFLFLRCVISCLFAHLCVCAACVSLQINFGHFSCWLNAIAAPRCR